MVKKVQKYIEEQHMLQTGDTVYAALSGGADSVCLLLILQSLASAYDLDLRAVHVEHGIRGEESMRDALFCEKLCETYGIPLKICRVNAPDLAKKQGVSLEEAARELRYASLKAEAGETGKIAVAHHMEDNCETMLFHLARGTGLDGMCGIRPVRGNIVRPLLCVCRSEIEAYLTEKQVSFCTDTTNFDISYTRNRIRHQVLPELTAVNAGAVQHFFAFSNEAEETVSYLDAQVEMARKQCVIAQDDPDSRFGEEAKGGVLLDIAQVRALHPLIGRRMIYGLLCQVAGAKKDITNVHVQHILELCEGETGRHMDLPRHVAAQSLYGQILLYKKKSDHAQEVQLPVFETYDPKSGAEQTLSVGAWDFHIKIIDFDGDLSKIFQKTYTKWFDYDIIKNIVLLRHRMPGDYLQVRADGGRKKLKNYLIDQKIPPKERDVLPLVADGSHILWVVGHRISEAYKVTRETRHILEICAERRMGEMEDERNHT